VLKRLAYLPLLVIIVSSCSTKKNTLVTRTFHNITARYNGYYYSNENIDEGVYKIERSHRDNFERTLPVYIYPSPEKAKSTFPEFDKAIKKSSLCIQRHAIKDKKGNEIASAGKWIDNNWINIGISHFYKREFFSAIEAFEYVVRTYTKSEDKYSAMLWLIKAYNEIGSVSSSEPIISLLKNERGMPWRVRRELPVAWADYYIRRGMYTEAIAKLMDATRNTNLLFGIPKQRRARYSFIIGQLAEKQNDAARATAFYRRTIKLKPYYEMMFYSRIKMARLVDITKVNPEKTKKDLLKMSKEEKNSEYFDVLFYTLGEIEEKQTNIDMAVFYYKKSVQTSVSNSSQKALSYLKLGEINFDRMLYQPAEAYYDSAVGTLPKDHPDYENILARKKTLETLVTHIRTINREDSLQRVAKLPEAERLAIADKLIAEYEKEKERKKAEMEAQISANPGMQLQEGMPGGQAPPGFGNEGASFYFYNPNTVALGVADFQRKWGNRRHEDNWRRSNKALVVEEEVEVAQDTVGKGPGAKDPRSTREYYLKGLPVNDTMVAKSNTKIIRAYYLLGSVYKEELGNTRRAVAAFEELNTRFPGNKYELNSWYMLYRTFLQEKNQPRADFYKEKILSEYPDSEFALLIKNPEHAGELHAQKSEVEAFYIQTFESYKAGSYADAYSKSTRGVNSYPKSEFVPKFEFIRAMSVGKLQGPDSLEKNLKLLVARHPTAEVTPVAQDILISIKKSKNPAVYEQKTEGKARLDTFNLAPDAEHFIIALIPDNQQFVTAFQNNLNIFNSTFYTDKKLSVTTTLLGERQMLTIKTFPSAKDAMNYHSNLMSDNDMFKGDVKRDLVEIYPILPGNIPFIFQKKSTADYKLFFEDNYKKAKDSN
jgi:tetratricopeptide (TPR) repeat protein